MNQLRAIVKTMKNDRLVHLSGLYQLARSLLAGGVGRSHKILAELIQD